MQKPLQQQIFSINSNQQFEHAALEIFRYQAHHNAVYKEFINGLQVKAEEVTNVKQIPFLPVEFFKNHNVVSTSAQPQITFSSSGTTGMITSRHYVSDVSWYEESFRRAFKLFYGGISNYCVLALLPAYLEREGSSLVYMADDFIKLSDHPQSGFYLYNHAELHNQLLELKKAGTPTLLIGVTFALLDFAEQHAINFPNLVVMETGGMKGRRKEMIRQELHDILCKGFGVNAIHSEYGMTELLSQAYSKGDGIFNCPPWMRIITRDTNDPLSIVENGKTGGVNIIDLANINSCSFIATQDLGKVYNDGSFEILGRFDSSDIRGCNLLVQ
ncbi:long-chain-fatty-acid--protein ligase [Mucilaginibacter aquatilis]|uniref:Acyl transferase n=1 Tax=Mucilaginibacter aquatilis TaxID=1517760 RepID=A0A6I4I3D2_9SPHI|nr:acyl transferase [Mucilaginibacter aquatilis]MVN89551.1 acyl transferase [Mucilaginibacter aquatilis]